MNDEGWMKFTDEIVNTLTFLLTAILQGGSADMSFSMIRAVNAFRCMIVSLGENFHNMFGMIWYVAKEFEKEQDIKEKAD